MISLRQHAISIAAIFLALAIGVVLGSSVLSDNLLSGLTDDKQDLQSQVHDLQSQVNAQNLQLQAADGFDSAVAGRVVGGTLTDRSVVVFTTPSAAPESVDAAVGLVAAAGGTVTGQVGLTEAFVTAQGADQLRATVTNVVPAGVQLSTGAVDPGSMGGDLLGAVLMLDPETAQPQSTPAERDLAMQTLRSGGFISYQDGTVEPGQLALVVTGTSDDGNKGPIVARFAAAMDTRGAGTVLAGDAGSAEGNGAVAVARSDAAISHHLSTVDNVERSAGQISTVLALREELEGRSGQFGVGPGAGALTVS
ncbi:copper transporter [Tomitella gaofuii]|uniref:copper transporter n=1 Tax=Tomitella gaofuii TaxID=2760083 RepID=UPI0015FB6955|nr:copper transporter [Tomitella gaofuii]